MISRVLANANPHRRALHFGDPENYHGLLSRMIWGDARAVAGLVEIEAAEIRILFGDEAAPEGAPCYSHRAGMPHYLGIPPYLADKARPGLYPCCSGCWPILFFISGINSMRRETLPF